MICPGMNDYLNLLLDFQSLPRRRNDRTFMEVAGYSHYENVCSNILAFYLDPLAEHGFEDLVLDAFLRMSGLREGLASAGEPVEVTREYFTASRKRIDLVIEGPDFVIGIENKIYHWIANDLEDYSGTIEEIGAKKAHREKVVLGLQRADAEMRGGFRSHTYRDLWANVRGLITSRGTDMSSKWGIHLTDFMENIDRLSELPFEIKEIDRFFIEHEDQITRLVEERARFHTRLSQRVSRLRELIDESAETKLLSKEPQIFYKCCLALDLVLDGGHNVAIDVWLTADGWDLTIFGREGSGEIGRQLGERFARESVANGESGGGTSKNNLRPVVRDWPSEADLAGIREDLCRRIRELKEVGGAYSDGVAAHITVTSSNS